MDETWLSHYDPETKQQSMEWRHSGSPRPKKNPSVKIRWKGSRLNFLGSGWHSPHWLSSKESNYQHGVLLISAGANEGNFEGKTPREAHKEGLVIARQCPDSPGTCNPEELAYLGFHCLETRPILRIWPRRTTTCSLDWNQLKGRHFSSDTEVIAAEETWLDGQTSDFFWVACKS